MHVAFQYEQGRLVNEFTRAAELQERINQLMRISSASAVAAIRAANTKNTIPVHKFDPRIFEVFSSVDALSGYWNEISTVWKALADNWVRISDGLPRLLEEATPDNLREVSIDDQLTLFRVSSELRVGIVRVIPALILGSLIEVVRRDATEVCVALLDHDISIVSHVRMRSEEFSHRSRDYADRLLLLGQSCRAYEDGHYAAAQSLAVVVLDSHMCAVSKMKNPRRFSKGVSALKDRIGDVQDATELVGWLRFFEYGALACALPVFTSSSNDDDLSRNSVVHGVHSSQFTRINALKSITVTGSVLLHDVE